MKKTLVFGKIRLRPLEPEDIDILYEWENNMEIWEAGNTKTPFSRYILAQYIKESGKDIYEQKQLRLIIQTETGEPVGAVDLFDFDPYHLRAGVGILIHQKSQWNQGYASDALAALSEYALTVLGLKQIYAGIAADNVASIRLFEKAGFEKTGIRKNWLKTLYGWKDEIFFQKMLG
jgi:diamine N-acetyltransferase